MENSNLGLGKSSKLSHVLSAFREVVISHQNESDHEPTPTEYFAVISSTMKTNIETEHLSEILQVLTSVIPAASRAIVQLQSKSLLPVLLQLVNSCTTTDQLRVLRHALDTIGSLCECLETSDAVWSSKLSLAALNALIGFIDDNHLKIQKIVQSHLKAILQQHKKANYVNVRSYIADFCIGVIKACTRSEYKRSLHVVIFLESIAAYLPESKIEELIMCSLNLETCDQPILSAAVYRMIDCFFQNSSNSLSTKQAKKCLELLTQKNPSTSDMETNSYYCTSVASVVTYYLKSCTTTSQIENVPSVIRLLLRSCESEFVQVHVSVATSLKRILTSALSDKIIQTQLKNTDPNILAIVAAMEAALQLRYQHAWIYVLDSIRFLFERLNGINSEKYLYSTTTKVCELYHALESKSVVVEKPSHIAVCDTVGAALRSCGVEMFLKVCPFSYDTTPDNVIIEDSREWILTIFQMNLRLMACKLSDYGKYILSLAKAFNKQIKSGSASDLEVKHLRMRVVQLWSLFPEFCYFGATDVSETFPHMPSVIQACLDDELYPELHQPIFQGLAKIASNCHERGLKNEKEVLQNFSSVIIGSILKILESTDFSDVKFTLGVQCISSWITISPKKIVDSIAKKLLQLLLQSTTAEELQKQSYEVEDTDLMGDAKPSDGHSHNIAAGWMSIMLVIIPHLSSAFIELLYRSVRPLLVMSSSSVAIATIQKRAYHILESLLKLHSAKLFSYEKSLDILSAISEGLLSCPVNSRSIRLKCVNMLLSAIENPSERQLAIDTVFSQILVCIKDANKKTRDEAMSLLRLIIASEEAQSSLEAMSEDRQSDYPIFDRLCLGVNGETPLIRSSAIIGLCMLLLEKREDHQLCALAANFFPNIASLLDSDKTSEQTRAVLSFVRVMAAILPPSLLSESLPVLIHCFTAGISDEKSKYLSRCRAIMRKLVHRVDIEELRASLPETDQPLLMYVLRMNRRGLRKRKEAARERIHRMLGSESDDDSEDEENSDDEPEVEDGPRFSSRPKAQRSDEVMHTFTTSADDLLDEGFGERIQIVTEKVQSQKLSKHPVKIHSKADDSKGEEDDGDDDFDIVVSPDGRVVLKQKEAVEAKTEPITTQKKKSPAENPEASSKSKKRSREPGEEYRSKKAGGDVWKRGMLQPHAYIPLDPRMFTTKNRREAISTLSSVVSKKSKRKSSSVQFKGRKGRVSGNRNQRVAAKMHNR